MTTRAKLFDFLLSGMRDPDTDDPLNGGSVEFYEVGTSTPKNVWTEAEKTNAFTSYTLGSDGTVQLYGDGNYKVVLKDSGGSTEYTFTVVKNQSNEFIVRSVSSATVSVSADDDCIIADTNSNSITLNLAAVAGFTRPLLIQKASASNNLVIDANGSELIDAATTYTLTGLNESVVLIPDIDAGKWRKANNAAITLVGMTATVAEINAAIDGLTATAAELNAAADGIGVSIPKMLLVEIGDWDMDGTSQKTVLHGQTDSKIVAFIVTIRDDVDEDRYSFSNHEVNGTPTNNMLTCRSNAFNSSIVMDRKTGGTFDSAAFDATSYNRGWILLFLID